jgi:hypothetical protein
VTIPVQAAPKSFVSNMAARIYPVLGGNACNPMIFGIGAEPGHHEHLSPSTRLPTDASGWRSMVRISIARIV